MFNSKMGELSAYSKSHDDSFSSGSDVEDYKSTSSAHCCKKQKRKSTPQRAIPHEFAITIEQKAKAGIFVVDPFHCRINVEFLKAFAAHHQTEPLFVNGSSTYFTTSSEGNGASVSELAPDMSHMGFTTGSSSEDENHHNHQLDEWDKDKSIKPSPSKKRVTSPIKKSRPHPPTNSLSKIVNSSSLPRPADNSSKFPVLLSPEQITKLSSKVHSNYKSYPQAHRHGSTPMDISTYPGVQLLTEDEYISCCILRIRPALYFHARNTLLHNYHHSVGYFRKSAAQKMLRIDVNKTGKLYDFLVRQRWLPDKEGGECRPDPEQVIIDDPETYHQL